MPYITSIERLGIEQGRREGLLAGLAIALAVKFGAAGEAVAEELRALAAEEAVLAAVGARLRTAATVDEVRAIYRLPDA